MRSMDDLLDALEVCGEAAAFYKGKKIVTANRRFADLFDKDRDECRDMSIIDICHEESIEMVCDFIKRRNHGDPDVPRSYSASFVNEDDDKIELEVTVLETENTEGAYLAVVGKANSY